MKSKFLLVILLSAITFSACKKGGGGGTTEVEPSKTPAGTNDGTAVTKTIGSTGGSIVSDDGEVELVIPSGALATNTDITLQPITNNIPTGRGKAYRFTPDGQQFGKDVTIKFHYTEEEAAFTKPEYMQVAFQNADGSWQVVDKVTNDVTNNVVSASVNHFTDFSQFDILRLVPASLYLKPGETKPFEIAYAGMTTNNVIAFGLNVLQTPVVWKANGVVNGNSTHGTIQSTAPVKANYTAPQTAPAINPVAIAAEVNIPFTVDGQHFNKGILTGQAFITGGSYRVTIDNELTIQIGTLEKFIMRDKVIFDVHLAGIQGVVDNIQNSDPTVEKIAESPAGCQTTFTRLGTGTMHFNPGQIQVSSNPISKTIYVGSSNIQGGNDISPIIHTACPGVTPGTNELPIAYFKLFNIEFDDSGQEQTINESSLYTKVTYTIKPL